MASLHLTLISDSSNQQVTTYRFTESGGSVGRSHDCDWTLNDTERFISNKHIIIAFVNGDFLVTDTSSNGTFVNNGEQPIGKGNSYTLKVTDVIKLGTFSIEVSAIELSNTHANFTAPNTTQPEVSQDSDLLGLVTGNSPTSNHPSASETAQAERLNANHGELGLFDILSGDMPTTPSSPPMPSHSQPAFEPSASQPDSTSADSAFSPFRSENTIPDNWDLDDDSVAAPIPNKPANSDSPISESAPQVPPPLAADTSPHQVATEPPSPPAAPQEQAKPLESVSSAVAASTAQSHSPADFFELLYHKLGLPKEYMHSVDQAEFANELVQILMTSTQGIMALLAGRSVLKQESRLNMTMIKPQSNNPIKFSLDPTDTLEMLLVKKKPGYLSAQAAYAEAMNDVQLHQMAFLSGLQATLDGVLNELAPDEIATEAEEKGLGFIGLKANAQKWQCFAKKQEKLRKQVKENLNDLLATHFSAAYQAHINNAKNGH